MLKNSFQGSFRAVFKAMRNLLFHEHNRLYCTSRAIRAVFHHPRTREIGKKIVNNGDSEHKYPIQLGKSALTALKNTLFESVFFIGRVPGVTKNSIFDLIVDFYVFLSSYSKNEKSVTPVTLKELRYD